MLDLKVWFGILAPTGTPDAVVDRLNAEFVKALRQPNVEQRLKGWGAYVVANTPQGIFRRRCGHARLWWWPRDSFFPAPLL
jgi:tripartite-type tricarboxylate transporter receptor subunit TctC